MAGVARRAWAAALVAGLVGSTGLATPASAETVRQAQWHIDALNVAEAQQISTGTGVTVAVIDSVGVDGTHPDLEGQVVSGISVGREGNGWANSAGSEHATGVAAIIAAKGGGVNHATGIAPGVKILPVGLSNTGSASKASFKGEDLIVGIRWAADHGAKVINMSLGSDRAASQQLVDAVAYAESKDVVLVAAAGNVEAGDTKVTVPASLPGVVAVSGTDRGANFWSGSVYGGEVAIAAPAVDIVSASPKNVDASGYANFHGTSCAAPIVAAAAALIRSKYPDLNAASVINRLIRTAKDQGDPGRDPKFGFGTVRLVDALTMDVPRVTDNPLGSAAAIKAPAGSANAGSGAVPSVTGSAGGSSGNRSTIATIVVVAVGLVLVIVVVAMVVTSSRKKAQVASGWSPASPGGVQPGAGGTTGFGPAGGYPPPGPPPPPTPPQPPGPPGQSW